MPNSQRTIFNLLFEKHQENYALAQANWTVSHIEFSIEICRSLVELAKDSHEQVVATVALAKSMILLGMRTADEKKLNEAIRLLSDVEAAAKGIDLAELLFRRADAYRIYGDMKGDVEKIFRSVADARSSLAICLDYGGDKLSDIQNCLGNCLWRAGMWTGNVEILLEASNVLMDALAVRTLHRVPREHASTQNNLGNVLQSIAEMQRDQSLIDKAIAAFKVSLQVYVAENAFFQAATVRQNLANAYRIASDIKNDTKLIFMAIELLETSLKTIERKISPMQWAMTVYNLAGTNLSLGSRENDIESINKAIDLYTLVLEFYSEKKSPTRYANSIGNRGIAKFKLNELSDIIINSDNGLNSSEEDVCRAIAVSDRIGREDVIKYFKEWYEKIKLAKNSK